MARFTPFRDIWPLCVAALVLIDSGLRADVYTIRREGAGIVPERSTTVSMDAEDVVVAPGEDNFEVTATFVMRNQSDQTVTSLVAFPIIGSGYSHLVDVNGEFKVELKSGMDEGTPFVATKVRLRTNAPSTTRTGYDDEPPKNVADYPEAVVWDVTWAPSETKVIRVHFEMGDPMVLSGSSRFAEGWQLMYIVRTGALWKGPIGRADISMCLARGNPHFTVTPGSVQKWSYPDQAKWKDKDTLAWHFENWTPTDDIWFRNVDWTGLPAQSVDFYYFPLPPYEGDKKAYSAEFIDSLVHRETTLGDQYFPERMKDFDVTPMRVLIGDWLLHEIYARHGDPFYLGKEEVPEKMGIATSMVRDRQIIDREGNVYSWWRMRFEQVSGRVGWYRPGDGPREAVKPASFSGLEQKNETFLRAYLKKLRPEQPPEYRALPIHEPGVEANRMLSSP